VILREWPTSPYHNTCEDLKNFVKNEDMLAYVSVVYSTSQGLAKLEYKSRSLLRNLLADIPNNRRTKIALIVLVQNISKEEAETLAFPLANKQAKSLTSAVIPKRRRKGNKGGRGGQKVAVKKEVIKKEVKEEEKAKFEKETDKDINFPKVDKVIRKKQKYLQTSKYPKD
jgi:hypothetical protein